MDKFPVLLGFFLLNFLWTLVRGDVFCDFKQSCILPCRFQPNAELVLHWIQTNANIHVHSFYRDQDQLGLQDKRFRGRTALFTEQLSNGNASLLLTGVEIQDEGTYKCYTSTIAGNKELLVNINVDVPVQKVNIQQVENKISCSSEGIYPAPELTWSSSPSSPLNYNSSVQPNGQFFDISSSLTLSGNDIDLNYSCTISTRKSTKNTKTATLFQQNEFSKSDSAVTLPCAHSKAPVTSCIWKFNNQVIVTQNEPGTPPTVSEGWQDRVSDVSETGALTLQSLSSAQAGVYVCEVTNAVETLVTKNVLQITEQHSKSNVTTAVVVVIVIGLIAAGITGILWKYCRKNFQGKSQNKEASDKLSEQEKSLQDNTTANTENP